MMLERSEAGYVAAWASETCDKAGTDRVDDAHEDNRDRAGRLLHCPHSRTTRGQKDVRRDSEQFRHVFANVLWIGRARSDVDPHIASVRPTQLLQLVPECRHTVQKHWISFGHTRAHGDTRQAFALLRTRRERPRGCRSAQKRDELASPHGDLPSCWAL